MKRKLSTNEKIQIAKEVIARAVEISETTKAQVFIQYSPHVDWIDWHFYERGPENSEMSEIRRINFDTRFYDPHKDLAEFRSAMDKLEDAEFDAADAAELEATI